MTTVIDSTLTANASLDGDLDLLMHLYHNGCPVDEETVLNACINGNVPILQWCLILYFQQCGPHDEETFV